MPLVTSFSEDDGWLLAYVFDESSQLGPDGEAKADAKSEVWIIDVKTMTDVVAKIRLPQEGFVRLAWQLDLGRRD